MSTRQRTPTDTVDGTSAGLDDSDSLCEALRISRSHLYNLLHQGLPSITIGRSRRFDRVEVLAWLHEHSDAA